MAFSPDGSEVAVGFWDGTASILDARTGKLIRRLEAAGDPIFSLAFSVDGKYLVGGHRDIGVSMWELATGKLVRNFEYEAVAAHASVKCVAISHDGKVVAGGLAELHVPQETLAPIGGSKFGIPRRASCCSAWKDMSMVFMRYPFQQMIVISSRQAMTAQSAIGTGRTGNGWQPSLLRGMGIG